MTPHTWHQNSCSRALVSTTTYDLSLTTPYDTFQRLATPSNTLIRYLPAPYDTFKHLAKKKHRCHIEWPQKWNMIFIIEICQVPFYAGHFTLDRFPLSRRPGMAYFSKLQFFNRCRRFKIRKMVITGIRKRPQKRSYTFLCRKFHARSIPPIEKIWNGLFEWFLWKVRKQKYIKITPPKMEKP